MGLEFMVTGGCNYIRKGVYRIGVMAMVRVRVWVRVRVRVIAATAAAILKKIKNANRNDHILACIAGYFFLEGVHFPIIHLRNQAGLKHEIGS